MLPLIATLVAMEGTTLSSDAETRNLSAALATRGMTLLSAEAHSEGRVLECRLSGAAVDAYAALRGALEGRPVDLAVQADVLRRKVLFLSDMDSTLIGQECIDELAELAGVGAQVAAITARAMAGEIEFEGALTERVALLAGLPESTLAEVWATRITPTPGAKTLLATLRAQGVESVVVSGGFTFFTERVARDLGFDGHRANQLEIVDGKLTGRVLPPLLGKEAKKMLLLERCQGIGIGPNETLALGDGANDLPMLETAGLGVAYRAKPAVEAAVTASIRHNDLSTVLHFLGVPMASWVQA